MSTASIAERAPWLKNPSLQKLLSALAENGEEARIAGGAVRNALLGQVVADIDIATTNLPQATVQKATEAGFKAVPTGIEHGTVTVVADGTPYEVTTLRDDIETDGRHAVVHFGRDWDRDAQRRDFTINALYATADGTVIDLVGGLADVEARRLRFIGDAEKRIREDYLRILRFFRFFAWYGDGRPDVEGLKACARLKDGLDRLSAERVWAELKKLLAAPDPSRALLWMRQSGVLSRVLPETEKWGIDAIHGLVSAEKDLGWTPDGLLRLEAILPPDAGRLESMAKRLKLSTKETSRLVEWATERSPVADLSDLALSKRLYFGSPQGIDDRLALSLAVARTKAVSSDEALKEAAGFSRLLKLTRNWKRPVFPLKGNDLAEIGFESGPVMGEVIRKLTEIWADSGFVMDKSALIEKAKALPNFQERR
ncbi:MAG: CCA tRNA nucleotidyltransferase [Rhizobiaceae bacterium]|nr:CCA tRNA nucleotidyltransferase [Rhizobiaceae bacterium]